VIGLAFIEKARYRVALLYTAQISDSDMNAALTRLGIGSLHST